MNPKRLSGSSKSKRFWNDDHFFLLGPRQTGKTTLIQQRLSGHRVYNLLKHDDYLRLAQDPTRLRRELQPTDKVVIIDEIQKLPLLLDEIHFLIEDRGVRFVLTGSSARKLRRQGVNLLGGRARVKQFHPFVAAELQTRFDLLRALDVGLIPSIYLSDDPHADLEAYIGTYLQEEIAAEAATRNVPAFGRFLTVAALCNAQLINYSNIANDAQVAPSTVREYVQILKDTLIADELVAFKQTVKRKPIGTSKLYFFDTGVVRFLQKRRGLQAGSPEFGEAFEAYIYHELRTYEDYTGRLGGLSFWRSASGYEVDFILGDHTAIEVKSTRTVNPKDFKGVRALGEECKLKRALVVCLEETESQIEKKCFFYSVATVSEASVGRRL